MTMIQKDILRNLLLVALMIGAYYIIKSALDLETAGKLTMQYAGIVGVYLGVWGYVIKSHYSTKPMDGIKID